MSFPERGIFEERKVSSNYCRDSLREWQP